MHPVELTAFAFACARLLLLAERNWIKYSLTLKLFLA